MALAERIVALFADPFPIDGQEIRVSASVGLAVHAENNQVGELLRNADIAMYAAKVQGKGRYVAFQPKMRMGIAAPAV